MAAIAHSVTEPGGRASLRDVTKVYDGAATGIRWRDAWPWGAPRPRSPFAALGGVDLTVGPGEALGIIGPNGAGKTTILKLLAGVTHPTSGEVRVSGSVSAMIELGVGFHPELTGWENIELSAAVHGLDLGSTRAAAEAVVDFADLRHAADAPLRTYSLGMQARLAFALATQVRTDLLLVDEILAVGDAEFQRRCRSRIADMVAAGTTLVLVSHEMPLVASTCARAITVEAGRIVDDGRAEAVVERYLRGGLEHRPPAARQSARIVASSVSETVAAWDRMQIDLEIEVTEPLANPEIGVAMSLPAVWPGNPIASTRADITELARPGRYRLSGTSTEMSIHNAVLRLDVDLVDGPVAEDHVELTCRLPDERHERSWFAVDPHWTTSPMEEVVRTAPSRRALSVGPDRLVMLDGVEKRYPLDPGRARLRRAVPGIAPWIEDNSHAVLSEIELGVAPGEAIGIIGPNGSGKSTLLRIIAGITEPDRGRVEVGCRVIPMLDLGSSLHPALTGRENIADSLAVLGSPDAPITDIIEMAGIGSTLDRQAWQYSSGTRARLGFAIAVHADGDLLLIDELLAVGDEQFRQAALQAVASRVRRGASAIFVSHSLELVEQLCHRVVRLDRGRIIADGPASEVLDGYGGSMWGSGAHDAISGVHIVGLSVVQRSIEIGQDFEVHGELWVSAPSPRARLELSYRALTDGPAPIAAADRTFYIRTLEPSGGVLARAGRQAFDLVVERHVLEGRFELALTVVDEDDGTILAERWQEVQVGHPPPHAPPLPVVGMTWTVEPIGPTAG